MSVECINYKPVNKGSLVGYADLFVPKMGIEIYGCSLHQKEGRRWVNLPSKEYTNDLGEKKYAPVVRFRNKEHMDGFTKVAKQAIEKKAAEMGSAQPTYADSHQEEELPF